MSFNTRKIIDYALNDEGASAREALYADIHDRVMEKFGNIKDNIAQSLVVAKESYGDDEYEEDLEYPEDEEDFEFTDDYIGEDHGDEKEDRKLVKKMVKKTCLTKK